MENKTVKTTKRSASRTAARVGSDAIVRKKSAPDVDFEALKACCLAIESCTSHRMRQATLDFLNSKYGSPGAS